MKITQLFAADPPTNCTTDCALNLPKVSATEADLQGLLGAAFGVFAALAVLVIVIASINIITGGGEPDKISRAKKTIIFALIGLTISLLAESIIYLVLGKF
jgi:hypothetical protein